MPLQPLTKQQIVRLGYEIARRDDWDTIIEFAHNYYGPKAYRVTLELGSQYDDEGGFISMVEGVSVEDAAGNLLSPDTAANGFQDEASQLRLGEAKSELDKLAVAKDIVSEAFQDLSFSGHGEPDFLADHPPQVSFTDLHGQLLPAS